MSEPSLMLRVETRSGTLPVEAFLRVARELSLVAAEVGRALYHEEPTIPSHPGGVLPSHPASEGGAGWRILDVQCESKATPDSLNDSNLNGLPDSGSRGDAASGVRSVALIIAPPPAQWRTAGAVREGVRAIHARCEERPEGFTDNALRSLRRVAATSGRQLRVTISAGRGEGQAVALDANIVAQIDTWLAGQRDALGSVEGQLEIISIHQRRRFIVFEKSTGAHDGARIECLFREALLEQVKSALGERVRIRGRIKYRKDGVPASVEAHWLRRLNAASSSATLKG